MGEKFRIVIAEDYTIVRQGLKSLLDSFPDFEIVGEAVDGKEAEIVGCIHRLPENTSIAQAPVGVHWAHERQFEQAKKCSERCHHQGYIEKVVKSGAQ